MGVDDKKEELPPSYFEATGKQKKKDQVKTSSEVESGGEGEVTLDLDSIQVTYQFTNPVAEQSSNYDYERQWSLPGMGSRSSSNVDVTNERRRSYTRRTRTPTRTESTCAECSRKFLRSSIVLLMIIIVVLVLFGNVYRWFWVTSVRKMWKWILSQNCWSIHEVHKAIDLHKQKTVFLWLSTHVSELWPRWRAWGEPARCMNDFDEIIISTHTYSYIDRPYLL